MSGRDGGRLSVKSLLQAMKGRKKNVSRLNCKKLPHRKVLVESRIGLDHRKFIIIFKLPETHYLSHSPSSPKSHCKIIL